MLSNTSELFGALTTIPSKDIDLNSYIAAIIGSIDKKIDFGNDLSLPFLGNSSELHNIENEPFITAFTIKSHIINTEDILKIESIS